MELIVTATDSELLDMARRAKVDQEDLPERIPIIREIVRISLRILEANSNMLRDPNALEPLEEIYCTLVDAEDEQWIEEEVAAVDSDNLPEQMDIDIDELFPDHVSLLSESDDDNIF